MSGVEQQRPHPRQERGPASITFDDVVGTYTTVRGKANAVDGITFTAGTQEIIGIAGESGCGKTTLRCTKPCLAVQPRMEC